MRHPARVVEEGPSEAGLAPRADRFEMSLPVRYRALSGHAVHRPWQEGQIQNISSSGVLFRAAAPLSSATIVELMFSLPSSAGQLPATVLCKAQVVRVAPPVPPETRTALAVAIQHYKLASG